VGLASKGASSWEVPVTALPSRKDGVVERAARICRQNLLFAKSIYRSGAACVPYSLPNYSSEPSTGSKIHSVVGGELQGNAISRIGIIGPYFFDADDPAVTVNSERYVATIQIFLRQLLRN